METFVVRIWQAAAPGEGRAARGLRRLHGVVEHVASGRSSAFRGLDELGALILSSREAAREPDELDALRDEDRARGG